MADTVKSNQQELSKTPSEAQSGGYSDIAANAWSGPSNIERGTIRSLPDGFPNTSIGEAAPDKPDEGNDVSALPRKGNHKGPNAVNSETAPDTPDKESFKGLVPRKRNSNEANSEPSKPANKTEDEASRKLQNALKTQDHLFEDLMNQLTQPLKPHIQRTQPSSPIQLKKY